MTLWPLKRMAQGSQAQTILRAAGSMRCWCSPANGVLHISQHSTVGRLRTNWRSVAKARSFWPPGVSGELTSHSHAPWPAAARPVRGHSPAAVGWVRDARYPNPCCVRPGPHRSVGCKSDRPEPNLPCWPRPAVVIGVQGFFQATEENVAAAHIFGAKRSGRNRVEAKDVLPAHLITLHLCFVAVPPE